MKEAIGKIITSYSLSSDRGRLSLTFADNSVLNLTAYGDCCSHTWIESIDNEAALKGKVFEIDEIDMPDLGSVGTPYHPCVDCVSYYGLRIVTENGHCVIDYRNDSNGYYGGWLEPNWTSIYGA